MDSVPEIQTFLDNNPSYCHEFRYIMGDTSAHLLGAGMLNYSEMLLWKSLATLPPKYAIQTGIPFWGQPEKKGGHRKKKLARALVPFANDKIEFCFVGSQIRREEP